MQIAVTRVKDVADDEIIPFRDCANRFENLRECGARNHGILHDQVARQSSHGAERLLASLPQSLALRFTGGNAHRARARFPQQLGNRLGLRDDAGLVAAVQLREQDGGGIARIPRRIHRILDGGDAGLIHHLEGRRDDACGDDCGDSFTCRPQSIEVRQHRSHRARQRRETHGNFRGDAEVSLGTDEQPDEIGTPRLAAGAAAFHHRAVGEHYLEREHVIRGDAVLETVWPAGVLGHVSADRAGALARGIGRVVQSVWPCRCAQLRVHDAGFDDGKTIGGIDAHDAIQSRQHEQHASGIGKRTTRQASACASRYKGHVVRGKQAHDRDQLFAIARKNDDVRNATMCGKAVHRIRDAFGASVADVPSTNDGGEVESESRRHAYILATKGQEAIFLTPRTS